MSVLLVTGGSRGIGAAVSRRAARAGFSIAVNYATNREAADGVVSDIVGLGCKAIAVKGDVGSEADVVAVVDQTVRELGPLTALVNSAGINTGPFLVRDFDAERLESMFRVNVVGTMLVCREAMRRMGRDAGGGGGAIVNISSISALRPRRLTVYTASKAAVIGITKAMAIDHGPEGIRVNCIAPGPVFTPMVEKDGMDPELRRQRAEASILGTEGTGWDIGNAVRFLLSNRARYITGQTLVVDAGLTLRAPARESQHHA